jgi:transmembrane sensor
VTVVDTELKAVREAAAGWRFRLAEDKSLRCRAEFDTWLRASPTHMLEYLSVWATHEVLLERAKSGRLDSLLDEKRDTTNVITLLQDTTFGAEYGTAEISARHLPDTPESRPPSSHARASNRPYFARSSWHWPAAYSATLILAVLLGLHYIPRSDSYRTQSGQRSITLPDASEMTLNVGTVAIISFSEQQRVVRLVGGDAFFVVAPDTRQFTILAGGETVRAGQSQQVAENASSGVTATVAVLDGHVSISSTPDEPTSDSQQQVAVITAPAGQSTQLSVSVARTADTDSSADRPEQAASTSDLRRALCWRTGPFEFHSISLESLVEAVNRCSPRQVRIADEELATRRFSGKVSLDHPEWLMRLLQNDPAVAFENDPDGYVIRSRFDSSRAPSGQ